MTRLRTLVRTALPRAVMLAVLATTGMAAAVVHAALLRTEPAAGSTVSGAPAEVRLWFSEPVDPAPDPLVVLDPRGARADEGARVSPEDATRLEARVRDAGPGTYTVRWRVVSEDGHVIGGAHVYHVGRATRSEPADEGDAPRAAGTTIARAVQDMGAALVMGVLALTLLLGATAPPEARRLATLGAAGALVALAGTGISAWAEIAALGGSPLAAAAAAGPTWAALWATRAAAAAGLLALFLFGRATGAATGLPRTAALALGGALLLGLAADGHARAATPLRLAIPSQMLHLAATGAWLGGAAALFLLLRTAHDRGPLLAVLPRFSTMSLVCVEILIATGLYQGWLHVARPGLLVESLYGRTLLAKLALLAVIAVPAALNRLVVLPRLAAGAARAGRDRDADGSADAGGGTRFGGAADAVTRLVGIEVAVGALIVLVGATLATLPPPVDAAAAVPDASIDLPAPRAGDAPPAVLRSAPAPAGENGTVVLGVDPGTVGSNEVRVSARDDDGAPRDAGPLRIRAVPPPGSGLASSVTTLAEDGTDRRATLRLDAAGDWTLTVLDPSDRAVDFVVPVR